MREITVQFDDVRKRYGDVQALDGLSFTAPARGCLGLLGPNGAGKTTAIKALLGLTRTEGGAIVRRAESVGYLPQHPALFGWMTAREYLRFVADAIGLRDAKLTERVDEWLERADLQAAAKRRVQGFSGGMKQRLGLAAALLQEPDLVVLDEPAAALDPVGRHEVLKLIGQIKQERAVIISTHILDDAARVCDEVVIMRAGKALLQRGMAELTQEVRSRFDIELAAPQAVLVELVARLNEEPCVSACSVQGAKVAVVLGKDGDVQRLLEVLASLEDLPLVRLAKSQASLEDIFLKVVGR